MGVAGAPRHPFAAARPGERQSSTVRCGIGASPPARRQGSLSRMKATASVEAGGPGTPRGDAERGRFSDRAHVTQTMHLAGADWCRPPVLSLLIRSASPASRGGVSAHAEDDLIIEAADPRGVRDADSGGRRVAQGSGLGTTQLQNRRRRIRRPCLWERTRRPHPRARLLASTTGARVHRLSTENASGCWEAARSYGRRLQCRLKSLRPDSGT